MYNQLHVRPGLLDNGWWPFEDVSAGEYEFELRRWPREGNVAICAPLPTRCNVLFVEDLAPEVALVIRSARISVDAIELTAPVSEDDLCVTFCVLLKEGVGRLETFFTDAADVVRGAYYVYVTKVA